MAIRNFWIVADIDGRKEKLTGGPRNKEGGFDLTVYMRESGGVTAMVEILGRADMNGALKLTVRSVNNPSEEFVFRTKR